MSPFNYILLLTIVAVTAKSLLWGISTTDRRSRGLSQSHQIAQFEREIKFLLQTKTTCDAFLADSVARARQFDLGSSNLLDWSISDLVLGYDDAPTSAVAAPGIAIGSQLFVTAITVTGIQQSASNPNEYAADLKIEIQTGPGENQRRILNETIAFNTLPTPTTELSGSRRRITECVYPAVVQNVAPAPRRMGVSLEFVTVGTATAAACLSGKKDGSAKCPEGSTLLSGNVQCKKRSDTKGNPEVVLSHASGNTWMGTCCNADAVAVQAICIKGGA